MLKLMSLAVFFVSVLASAAPSNPAQIRSLEEAREEIVQFRILFPIHPHADGYARTADQLDFITRVAVKASMGAEVYSRISRLAMVANGFMKEGIEENAASYLKPFLRRELEFAASKPIPQYGPELIILWFEVLLDLMYVETDLSAPSAFAIKFFKQISQLEPWRVIAGLPVEIRGLVLGLWLSASHRLLRQIQEKHPFLSQITPYLSQVLFPSSPAARQLSIATQNFILGVYALPGAYGNIKNECSAALVPLQGQLFGTPIKIE